jgi:hypothetical protein
VAHYFLGNRLLGASAHRPWYSDTQLEYCNTVFVCPICGDAWGRIVLSPSAEWAPIRSGCALHPWPYDVGGSFLHPWLRRLEGLPPELLVHEFNLRYERLPHANVN